MENLIVPAEQLHLAVFPRRIPRLSHGNRPHKFTASSWATTQQFVRWRQRNAADSATRKNGFVNWRDKQKNRRSSQRLNRLDWKSKDSRASWKCCCRFTRSRAKSGIGWRLLPLCRLIG